MHHEVKSNNNTLYRISDNAYQHTIKVLRFPSVTAPDINGQACRITSIHDLGLSLKTEYLSQYQHDQVVQVRLLNDNSRDFIVLKSLLQPLPASPAL
jgi:hypothetical protein